MEQYGTCHARALFNDNYTYTVAVVGGGEYIKAKDEIDVWKYLDYTNSQKKSHHFRNLSIFVVNNTKIPFPREKQ
ncbi:hypothetical protein [Chitinophaga ginsengisoli]|uniref:hypothetical protein n=1 Tax=Chitinophaga ginsengisoli TaxID=363837 RepID=UPI0011B21266|nr:hypothetical protein [Chitinophaga ginsengisoli]